MSMADAELSAKLARRRLRSRASNEELQTDDIPSPLPKQPEINNNMQTGRRRRSRASNSSEDLPSPGPSVASKPIGFVQPEVQRQPQHQNEVVSEVTPRRRSRASRSSVEEPPPTVAPKPLKGGPITPTRHIVTPCRSVRESASKFENIVNKITTEEEQYHKQQQHQKEIHQHQQEIEEQYSDDYEDDDDYYNDEDDEDAFENDLEVEQEMIRNDQEVRKEDKGEFLMDNIRQHMEAYEPFGQMPFDENEYDDDQLEYSDDEEEMYRTDSEDTDDTARLADQSEQPNHQQITPDQSKESNRQRTTDRSETGSENGSEKYVSKSFVTVGSASGQQQPQAPPKQQVVYQQTNQTPRSQPRGQPTNQQQAQRTQPPQPAQTQRQQQRVQASPKQQPQISVSSSEEYYSPYQAQPFTMSMRAPRAGDMFHNEMKMEKRYDEEEKLGTPQRVLEWIARSLQQAVPAPNGADWKSIQLYIRDGVILCKLLNKLLKHAGMDPVGYRQKVNSAFVALNNLETFMAGAKRYGVPQTSFFQPSDLYEGRKGHLLAVVNTLNALGCVANARGFTPAYQEPAPPKADWCKEECYD